MTYRIALFLFLLICWVNAASSQNSLYIMDENGHGVTSHEVLTGKAFQLDYTFSFPSDECKKVKLTFTSISQFVNLDIVFNGTYTRTNTSLGFIITIIPTNDENIQNINNAQNIKINGTLLNNGTICENVPIPYQLKKQYYDENDNQCGGEIMSNTISIIPKYSFTYYQNLQIQNNATACKGGFIKYKLQLPIRPNQGFYRLNNAKFRCEVNGALLVVLSETGNSWAITDVTQNSTNCNKIFEFNYKGLNQNFINLNTYSESIELIFKTDCTCFNTGQSFNLKVVAMGKDPCGKDVSFFQISSHNFNVSCCSSPSQGEVQVSKDLDDNNKPFCSGGCHPYYYNLKYNNGNSAVAVNNLKITDPIPNGVEVLNINLPQFQYNGIDLKYKVCYTTNTDAVEQCLQVGLAPLPYATWNVSPMNIRYIRFEFIDPIPAWYSKIINFKIGFKLRAGVEFLNNNIATFSSNSPAFNIIDTVVHGQVPICNPYYSMYLYFIKNNNPQLAINSYPSEIERIRLRVFNLGYGMSPKGNIIVNLPSDINYIGNLSHGFQLALNPVIYQTLPTGLIIDYNPSTRQLVFSNLDIPSCTTEVFILEFDVKVSNGAYAGVREVQSMINNGYLNKNSITINSFYKIKAKIYQRCKSGDLIPLENKVLASESLEYVYELENVGNESVDNITLFNHKPTVNDFTLNSLNQTSRNSEVSTIYSGQIYELNQIPVQAQYISSLNGNPICAATFGGNTTSQPENALMMVMKPQDLNFILGPGQKLQIVQKHNIGQGQSLNLGCNNDFSFCLRRINPDTKDNGISDQIRLTLSDTTLCPKVVACDELANIETRFEDAFNVQVSGNQVTLTSQNLSSNDQWSVIWDDEQYFANESHWGNQTVSRTFSDNVNGQHKLCIKIKNHLEANNSQSQECKCELICKTFNLN